VGVAAEQDTNERTAVERRDPLLGAVFDRRFRVDAKLAAGGFGAIYRATHLKSGHEFALKVLHANLTHDVRVVARFRREGEALTRLRDPHTITAYELGEAPGGTLYIVMELLHGETLYDRIHAEGPLPWRRAMVIARAVCSSLAEAHAHGIIHRDLKPTNIHLERRGNYLDFVKVLDFGIAKLLQDSDIDRSDLTQAGQMIGTLDYMSPEQMVGGLCTATSDIYTLGIVMYEMITGRKPFDDANSAAAALAAVLTTTPLRVSEHVPVPADVEHVVMRCLERAQGERYQTAAELAIALDELLSRDDDLAINVAPRRAEDAPTAPVSASYIIESIPDPQRAPTVPLRARGFARGAASIQDPLAAALQAAAAAHSSVQSSPAVSRTATAEPTAPSAPRHMTPPSRDDRDIGSHTASITAPRLPANLAAPRNTYNDVTYPRPQTQPPPSANLPSAAAAAALARPAAPRISSPRLVPRGSQFEPSGTSAAAPPSAGAPRASHAEPAVLASSPRPAPPPPANPTPPNASPMFAEGTPGQTTPASAYGTVDQSGVMTSATPQARLAPPRSRNSNPTPLSGAPMKSLREAYPMIHQPPPSAMRPPQPAFDELPTALVGSVVQVDTPATIPVALVEPRDPTTRRLMIGICVALALIAALIANWLVTAT
jgi:serine/threonine-protein kinase